MFILLSTGAWWHFYSFLFVLFVSDSKETWVYNCCKPYCMPLIWVSCHNWCAPAAFTVLTWRTRRHNRKTWYWLVPQCSSGTVFCGTLCFGYVLWFVLVHFTVICACWCLKPTRKSKQLCSFVFVFVISTSHRLWISDQIWLIMETKQVCASVQNWVRSPAVWMKPLGRETRTNWESEQGREREKQKGM